MSRTMRFCNKKFSPLFEHSFKFFRRHCRCDYCIDPESSKHRRARNKLEVKRELDNLGGIEVNRYAMRRFYSIK